MSKTCHFDKRHSKVIFIERSHVAKKHTALQRFSHILYRLTVK